MILLPDDQLKQISPDVRTFLENLLEDAGMQLSDDLKNSMILDLNVRLEKKIIADAIDHMQPQDTEEFIKLVQSTGDQKQIESFITSKIPNAKEVFMKSMVDFRSYFLEGTTKANQPQAQA